MESVFCENKERVIFALKQVEESILLLEEYLIPYTAEGKRLVKVGVSFSREKRNVGEWKVVEE